MTTNDFLPFAFSEGANVLSQQDYKNLKAIANGFGSGVAKSAELNKVWRQASIMSAVLAQLIVDGSGQDAIDDGTTATLLANLKLVLSQGTTQPPSDDSTKLATTQFVQQALGGNARAQVFTASGTFIVPANVSSVKVTVVGGGGGGSGCQVNPGDSPYSGAGGGAAGTAIKWISGLNPGESISIIVGKGGIGGTGQNSGANGGDSKFGTYCIAYGGGGGVHVSVFSTAGGYGAGASGGDVNISGGDGGDGIGDTTIIETAYGGASSQGGGGRAGAGGANNGGAPGSGGGAPYASAALGTPYKGGDGADGIVIVEY